MFQRNSLMAFIIKAVLAIVGLSLVWSFIAPHYNRVLVGAADWLVASCSLTSDAGDIYFYSPAGGPVAGIHGAALHFGLVLLLALLIATPGLKIINRFRNIGIGLAVMFVFHLVTLVALAGLMQSGSTSPSSGVPVVLISTIGLNLVPALIWGGLCLRQWLAGESGRKTLTQETPQPVNAT
jgi:hypothetical protein